jgi:hypothetical protein
MLLHECSVALEFMKRRPLDSSCHAAHAYPSHSNSEIDHDLPPLMNEAASLILVSVRILSPTRSKKRKPVTRCSITLSLVWNFSLSQVNVKEVNFFYVQVVFLQNKGKAKKNEALK